MSLVLVDPTDQGTAERHGGNVETASSHPSDPLEHRECRHSSSWRVGVASAHPTGLASRKKHPLL